MKKTTKIKCSFLNHHLLVLICFMGYIATSNAQINNGSNTLSNNSSSTGNSNTGSGSYSFSAGSSNNVTGSNSSAFGISNTVSGSFGLATGYNNLVSGNYSFAAPFGAKAQNTSSVAIGHYADANANYSVAIGELTKTTGLRSLVFGYQSEAAGGYSMAIGTHLKTTNGSTYILGKGVDGSNKLKNNISNSLVVGFYSDTATLFVGPSTGVGTFGKVGIATSSPIRTFDVNGMSHFSDTMSIGTTKTNGSMLAVAGKISAEEVEISLTTTWPDFVFSTSYELNTLAQVEEYINQHSHLPNVPSAEEVAEKGINIAEMDAILLQKIEELTLYAIAQQKQLDKQNEAAENQQKQLDKQNKVVENQQKLIEEQQKLIEQLMELNQSKK